MYSIIRFRNQIAQDPNLNHKKQGNGDSKVPRERDWAEEQTVSLWSGSGASHGDGPIRRASATADPPLDASGLDAEAGAAGGGMRLGRTCERAVVGN